MEEQEYENNYNQIDTKQVDEIDEDQTVEEELEIATEGNIIDKLHKNN